MAGVKMPPLKRSRSWLSMGGPPEMSFSFLPGGATGRRGGGSCCATRRGVLTSTLLGVLLMVLLFVLGISRLAAATPFALPGWR